MKKWKAVLALLLTFAAGVALGLVIAFHGMRYRMPDGPPPPRHMARWLSHHLDLTEEQEVKVLPILEASGARAKVVLDEMKPRLDAIMDETASELRPLLNDEQRAELDAIVERVKERRGPFGPPHAPRSPHSSGS